MKNLKEFIEKLISIGENETIEFKENFDKKRDGEEISAISNSSFLGGQEFGYILWGIDDNGEIVGTNFNPDTKKIGNEPIKNWLIQRISPRIEVRFYIYELDNKKVILGEIPRAVDKPTLFMNSGYVRIGEVKRKLIDFPEREKKIWSSKADKNFEKNITLDDLSEEEVLKLIDYDAYFQLTKQSLPSETIKFLEKLENDGVLIKKKNGLYEVTVLGSILFAREISKFPLIKRKSVRVITYSGNSRIKRIREFEEKRGYAVSFENVIDYINSQTRNNEEINKALRVEKKMYPDIAIREFLANALIHQDLPISGTGPLVEIFDNRIEITNPGLPLIDVERFIDHPPRSRNEDLASFMRRLGFCEESGSGVDRALIDVEIFQLPAPKFEVYEDFTRVTLFAHRKLKDMSNDDRIRACYQHCALKWVTGEKMTNKSLRERLNISEKNYPIASNIIAHTKKKGLIKSSEKSKEYVPWWA